MTAHTDENTIVFAKKTKHVGFLFKPFESFQLKEAIEGALEQ
jgi:FixJ family two-component response regulator